MKKNFIIVLGITLLSSLSAFAGGILTNTNQNIAFNRMMSREASIGIDGVYTNPAGVAFMSDGSHLSLNWQMAIQTREIDNTYPLFALNTNNPTTQRKFKGEAFAPVVPSFQYAYNWNGFSFQAGFAVGGGGGKCVFDKGLGSFEKIVANSAAGVNQLALGIDQASQAYGFGPTALPTLFSSGAYTYDAYMRGRQYYYGLSLATAYKVNDNLAVSLGLRGVYGMANYYGYVKDITVGGTPLSAVLPAGADIELNCDQTGIGFTPIIGIDYRVGRWNFSAKYEFKTRMRLENQSVNRVPDLTALPAALITAGVNPQLLANPAIQQTLLDFNNKFSGSLEEAIGEFEDGQKVKADIPALLTAGVSYRPIDALRLNAGFHYFFDKDAKQYNDRQKKLDHNSFEITAGAEYDINKLFTVSAGWQTTNYGITDEYMDDKSFVVSSNSIGVGACIHASKKIDVNIAYFGTFYQHKKVTETDAMTNQPYTADYTRTNNVFGVGVDFTF